MDYRKKNFLQKKHNSTVRNYLERVNNDKINCVKISKKFSYDYWDGDRKYGYGGYKFIEGYWEGVALNFIKTYKLKNSSSILDIGCGKGYLLYEIKKKLPEIGITGVEFSKYAINNSHPEIKKNIIFADARKKLKFKNNQFHLAFSLATFHNFDLRQLEIAISEITRISKKQYLMVESFRNNIEMFNLQCWALTAETLISTKDWMWLFKKLKYKGDYEFIYFK